MARRTLLKGLAAVLALVFGAGYVTQVLAQKTAQAKSPLLEDRYETWYEPAHSPQHAREALFDQSRVPAQPDDRLFYPGDFATVVYQTFINGNWDIYKLDKLSSTTPVPLITSGSAEIMPRLNTQKNRVVFATNRDGQYEIYSCDLSGGDLRGLSAHPATDSLPTWSPDGGLIAFTSDRDRNPEIYTMNADGSNQRRLTSDPATDLDPVFSPDGQQIAWIRVISDIYGEIRVMNVDGTGQRHVGISRRYLRTPAWSPDGRLLIAEFDDNADGWLDVGSFRTEDPSWVDGYVQHGEYMTDLTMGSWISSNQYMYAKIFYRFVGSDLYIYDTAFVDGGHGINHQIPLGLYPWGEGDTLPPLTRMDKLPLYCKLPEAIVKWWAADRGPAGLMAFAVGFSEFPGMDYQHEAFADGIFRSMNINDLYSITPGSTIYYKMKGYDFSSNESSYPNVPFETFTTYYNYDLISRALDLRGYSLGGVKFETSAEFVEQPISGDNGYSHGRYISGDVSIAALSGDGTTHLQETRLYLPDLTVYNWLLGSAENFITNGNFASETLHPWQASGPAEPVVRFPIDEPGIYSYMSKLGQVFLPAEVELIYTRASIYANEGTLVRGEDGTVYAFWGDSVGYPGDPYPYSVDLVYSVRQPGGTWSEPEVINPEINGAVYILPQALFDSSGELHLVWAEHGPDEINILSQHRAVDGTWSEIDEVFTPIGFENIRLKLQVDAADTLHLVILSGSTLRYISKPLGGSWSTPSVIADAVSDGEYDFALDPAGGAHVIYFQHPDLLQYRGKPAGSSWQALQTLKTGIESQIELEIDPGGNWHLLYTTIVQPNFGSLYYWSRTSDGVWRPPVRLDNPEILSGVSMPILVLLTNGDLWVYWQKEDKVVRVLENGVWTPEMISPRNLGAWSTISDGENGVMTFENISPYDIGPYFSHLWLPENASGGISQIVTIPSDLHEPTLALHARSESYNQGGEFSLLVNNTQVYSTTAASNTWQSIWVDMTDWLGEQVTVTLRVENPSLADALIVAVDDINLGAWKTQVVSQITLDELPPANQGQMLTLTGENFFGTPEVWLGNYRLSSVQVVSATMLRATIPVRIPVGRYNLRVFHTGEVQNTIFNAVLVGTEVFIPVTMK